MKTETLDIQALVQTWSEEERQTALATLISDLFAQQGETYIPVADVEDRSLAIIMPCRLRAEEFVLDESTPYGQEIRRRIETADQAIPIEDLLDQLQAEEAASIFHPNMSRVLLTDGSGRWFDETSARKWKEAATAHSADTGMRRETLCLTRKGTFILQIEDERDPIWEQFAECTQQQAMAWLRANGHDVDLDRLLEAKEIRRLEV